MSENDNWDPDSLYPMPDEDESEPITSSNRLDASEGISYDVVVNTPKRSNFNKAAINKTLRSIELKPEVNFDIKDPFADFVMTKEDRQRLKNMNYLIPDLIPEGYSIILYGHAGSGKTTVCHYLAMKIAKQRPDMIISSLYLDGAGTMASDIEDHIEREGITNYRVAYKGTATEINNILLQMGKADDLSKHVIIYDTFKYLTENINCKSSNKKAIHNYLKPLTKLGATIIMLHHTNKDGDKFAGTAELEQDTDGMIKAQSFKNGDQVTTSFIEGGRCRFPFKERSFIYTAGKPDTVIESDFVKPSHNMDMVYALKDFIGSETKIKRELIEFLMDRGLSRKDSKNLIFEYCGIFWKFSKGEKNIHQYSGMTV